MGRKIDFTVNYTPKHGSIFYDYFRLPLTAL